MNDARTHILDRVSTLFIEFFIFSVGGWVFETCYCSIIEGRFADRGFLFGPYCPIYGFAILAGILFFSHIKSNTVLFVVSALIVTIFEYFTSWALEVLYHARWWDYTNMPFNLNGRICLFATLFFGFGTLVTVRYIHPKLERAINSIPFRFKLLLSTLLLVLLITDLLVTHFGLMAIRDSIDEFYGMITTNINDIYTYLSTSSFV